MALSGFHRVPLVQTDDDPCGTVSGWVTFAIVIGELFGSSRWALAKMKKSLQNYCKKLRYVNIDFNTINILLSIPGNHRNVGKLGIFPFYYLESNVNLG